VGNADTICDLEFDISTDGHDRNGNCYELQWNRILNWIGVWGCDQHEWEWGSGRESAVKRDGR
jgi:hypothetical protein